MYALKYRNLLSYFLYKLHKSIMFAVLEIIRISCSFNNSKLSMTASLKIYSKFVLSNWNLPSQMQKLARQKMADLRLISSCVLPLPIVYSMHVGRNY